MAERFFTKVANDALEATEQIVNRMEEGWEIVFGGGKQQQQENGDAPGGSAGSTSSMPEFDDDIDDEELEEVFRNSPLKGMAEGVMNDIMSQQATPQTFMEHVHAFRSAITWSEPFIVGLVLFQIGMLMASFYVSRRNAGLVPRIVMMVVIAAMVKSSEYMNTLAAQHWRDFATQNYFDARGIFMAVFVCAPLLLDSLIMLLFYLREASQLLVQLKTMELKKKGKQEQSNKRRAKKDQ